MPRPNTPIIHPRALDLPRAVSGSNEAMPYQVRIADPNQKGPLNTGTGQYDTTPGQVAYLGPARLKPMSLVESRQYTVADQPDQRASWWLRLPIGARVLADQRVDVLDCDPDYADEGLVGRAFRIIDHRPKVAGTELTVTLREEPVPRTTGEEE